jgi:DNA-binding NarL/FixJ family response regulator
MTNMSHYPHDMTEPKQRPHRIFVADDHMMVREGIKMRLSIEDDFEVIGEAANGADALKLSIEMQPDLLLLDLDLPLMRGTEVAAAIKASHADIKVVILTGSLTRQSVNSALAAGADGYVTKQDDDVEMLKAIRAVLAGQSYISTNIAEQFTGGQSDMAGSLLSSITEREREVLALLASGMSNNAIAEKIFLAIGTVRKHRENIMVKLGLHNAAELTAFAIKNGVGR